MASLCHEGHEINIILMWFIWSVEHCRRFSLDKNQIASRKYVVIDILDEDCPDRVGIGPLMNQWLCKKEDQILYLEEGEGGNRQTLICKYEGTGLRKFIPGSRTFVSEIGGTFVSQGLSEDGALAIREQFKRYYEQLGKGLTRVLLKAKDGIFHQVYPVNTKIRGTSLSPSDMFISTRVTISSCSSSQHKKNVFKFLRYQSGFWF